MNTLDRSQIAKTVRVFLEKRRPEESLRSKVDFGFRFYNQSVELLEIRAKWDGRPGKTEHAFAKATFVKSRNFWKVYWMRASLKWHPYEPAMVGSLEEFLELVDVDKHCCFFG